MITVAAFDNVLEAGYWRGMLEAHGIPAVLVDQEVVALKWHFSQAVGNIKLQVPQAEARRAHAILEEARRAIPERAPAAPDASRALLTAMLGFLLPPIQLYSVWIVLSLAPRWRELSPPDRRRLVIAALLDLWFPLFIASWIIY